LTTRLILRPFQLSDAATVQRLAGHPKVAATTALIPHPYLDGLAEEWIGKHIGWFARGAALTLAIALKPSGELIGWISLGVSKDNSRAELGYWLGVEHWNKGYCSEAAKEIVRYG